MVCIKPGMLLVHPLLEEMKAKDMFIKASDDNPCDEGPAKGLGIGTWWGGPGVFVDFTKPSTRKYWKEYITEHLLKYGCESIWASPSGTTTANMTAVWIRMRRFILRGKAVQSEISSRS